MRRRLILPAITILVLNSPAYFNDNAGWIDRKTKAYAIPNHGSGELFVVEFHGLQASNNRSDILDRPIHVGRT